MGSRNQNFVKLIINYNFLNTIVLLLSLNGQQISCNSVARTSSDQICASLSISNNVNDRQTKYEIPVGSQQSKSYWDTLTSSPNTTVNSIEVSPGCVARICHLNDGSLAKMQKCDNFTENKSLTIEDTKSNYNWDTFTSTVLGVDCNCKHKDKMKSCSTDCENYPIKDQCQCATLFLDEYCNDCSYDPIPLYMGSSYSRKDNLSIINSIFVKKKCVVQGFNGKDRYGKESGPYTFLPDKVQTRQRINEFNYDFQSFKCICEDDAFDLDDACQTQLEAELGSIGAILLSLVGLGVLIVILIAILLVDQWIQRYKYKRHLYSVIKNLDKKWIIPEDQIEIDENTVLGEGMFGKVLKGTLKPGNVTVAVKKLKSSSFDTKYFGTLAREIQILSTIGSHPNVVSMIGIVSKSQDGFTDTDVQLVLEYCKHNSLEKFIRQHRNHFLQNIEGYLGFSNATSGYEDHESISGDYIEDETEENAEIELTCQHSGLQSLTQWSLEICCGMEHIRGLNIIHLDLAARNVLLDENFIAKVSDLGLSKQLDEHSLYYFKLPTIKNPLPKHPMALETMKSFKFSLQSDIWAYGVCIWELFTLGQIPYEDLEMPNDRKYLIRKLEEGYRFPRPNICPSAIYEKLYNCWIDDPSKRPDFIELKLFFSNYLTLIRNVN